MRWCHWHELGGGAVAAHGRTAVIVTSAAVVVVVFVDTGVVAKSNPRKDVPIDHPTLAMALTMDAPNKDVGGQTVRAMQSIRDNGHHIAHLTFDRGYRGVDGLLEPLRDMGIPVNMGYKVVDLGIHGSAGGGTKHVEGAHYCPATPEELLESSKNFEEGSIDWDTWQTHLQERIAYASPTAGETRRIGQTACRVPGLGSERYGRLSHPREAPWSTEEIQATPESFDREHP